MTEQDNPLRPLWNEMKAKDDERRALRARVIELEEKYARCSDAFDECFAEQERLRARVAELEEQP